jgi:hypothetical protein
MRQDQTTFGECSLCKQGTLIAMKQSDEHSLALVRDDCESQWLPPSDATSADKALVQERTALVAVTNEDLRKAGWC